MLAVDGIWNVQKFVPKRKIHIIAQHAKAFFDWTTVKTHIWIIHRNSEGFDTGIRYTQPFQQDLDAAFFLKNISQTKRRLGIAAQTLNATLHIYSSAAVAHFLVCASKNNQVDQRGCFFLSSIEFVPSDHTETTIPQCRPTKYYANVLRRPTTTDDGLCLWCCQSAPLPFVNGKPRRAPRRSIPFTKNSSSSHQSAPRRHCSSTICCSAAANRPHTSLFRQFWIVPRKNIHQPKSPRTIIAITINTATASQQPSRPLQHRQCRRATKRRCKRTISTSKSWLTTFTRTIIRHWSATRSPRQYPSTRTWTRTLCC